ncbi:MAG: hypothetical protein O7F12_01000 [Nitrospirae bacterium]|nr:hypothetical protein [Nitrospirota bacterium]
MRKALNNPIVVGILCVVALVCVYWRMSAPPTYLTEVDAGVVEEDPIINAELDPSPHVSSRPPPLSPAPVILANASNPSVLSSKAIIAQWKEVFSRDPFQFVQGAMTSRTEKFQRGESNISEDSLPARKALHLQAVLVGGPRRFAVINHQVLAEGEKFDGFLVVRIHANGVVFTDQLGEHQVGFENQRKEESSEGQS